MHSVETMCDQPDCPVAECCYRFMVKSSVPLPTCTYRWFYDDIDESNDRGYGGECKGFVEIMPGDELRR